MNSIKRLERMLVKGVISKEEYLERIGAYEVSREVSRSATMKTAKEIIAFLEAEMNEAFELHHTAKENKDTVQACATLLKAHTIGELLDVIKAK